MKKLGVLVLTCCLLITFSFTVLAKEEEGVEIKDPVSLFSANWYGFNRATYDWAKAENIEEEIFFWRNKDLVFR